MAVGWAYRLDVDDIDNFAKLPRLNNLRERL